MCIVYDEDSSCQKLHAKVVHKIMFISYIVPNIEVVEKNTSKKNNVMCCWRSRAVSATGARRLSTPRNPYNFRICP